MNSPFPGMNPYLENPVFWSEVHYRLIAIIADEIEPNIPPQYRVAIEQRTYLSDEEDSLLVGIPDVTIFSQQSNQKEHSLTATQVATTDGVTVTIPMPENVTESYLEIQEIDTGFVITTIEILSPKNKRAGEGRKAYERKRKQVLASLTHLVEIDLLRNGRQMSLLGEVPATDYRIVVSQSEIRPQAKLYGFSVREKIPPFVLPLQSGDKEVILDLQPLLNRIYARARYYLSIDYNQEPIPPLKAEDKAWADAIIRGIGNRE
jgi:hypothetical protein